MTWDVNHQFSSHYFDGKGSLELLKPCKTASHGHRERYGYQQLGKYDIISMFHQTLGTIDNRIV